MARPVIYAVTAMNAAGNLWPNKDIDALMPWNLRPEP